MAQTSNTSQVWPVNNQGELIIVAGTGNSTIAGQLPSNFVPLDIATGGVRAVGIPNIVMSSSAPVDADGKPDGTIYIQTV